MYKKILCFVFVASLITGCLGTAPFSTHARSTPTPPLIYSPRILENSLELSFLWEKPGVTLSPDGQKSILLTMNKVIFIETSDPFSPKLLCFDMNSGNLLWETKLPDAFIDVAYDQENLFVLTLDNVLLSYKIDDGSLMWKTTQIKNSKLMVLERGQEALYIVGLVRTWDEKNDLTQIYTIDPLTGIIAAHVQEIKAGLSARPWFLSTRKYYWASEDEVFVSDPTFTNIGWRFSLPKPTGQLPELHEINSEILLMTSYMRDSLYAVKINNGSLAWQYNQQIISNPDSNSNSVYILLPDYKLLGFDLFSGKEKGYLQFSTLPNIELEANGNFIVASEDNVAIYFGQYHNLLIFSVK
jgi:outer membrane protein assembly factor BamB